MILVDLLRKRIKLILFGPSSFVHMIFAHNIFSFHLELSRFQGFVERNSFPIDKVINSFVDNGFY